MRQWTTVFLVLSPLWLFPASSWPDEATKKCVCDELRYRARDIATIAWFETPRALRRYISPRWQEAL